MPMAPKSNDRAMYRPDTCPDESAKQHDDETLVSPTAVEPVPHHPERQPAPPRDISSSNLPASHALQSPTPDDGLEVVDSFPGPLSGSSDDDGDAGSSPGDDEAEDAGREAETTAPSSPVSQADPQQCVPSPPRPLIPPVKSERRVTGSSRDPGVKAYDSDGYPSRATSRYSIEEENSLIKEARYGLGRLLVSAMRIVTTNSTLLYIFGWLIAILLAMMASYLCAYAIWWGVCTFFKMVIDAIVEGFIRVSVGSVCAVFNYTWPWGSVVYHTISAPVVAACYALSTHVGLVNPTVLPDLGPEYGVVPPPIRRQPLVHVDGIALAHAVMAPGARELERFRDEQPGTTSNYLYFAAGVALQVPLAPFDTKLGKSIDQIKADNDRLGKLMHPRLEAERDALRSFRRLLRKQPAAGVLEKSEAYPVGRRTYSAASWLGSVWQTVLATLRRALQRSVRSHLLRRVDDLDQILQNGLSGRKEWIHSLAPSSLSKVEEMVGPVCQASRDLTDAKWQLEAKVDELHVATLGSGGSFELAGGTAGIQAELTSGLSGIRTAQSSFTNMCMFAWADRNAATDVISRLAHDIEVYMYAQESLKKLRDRIQADPLNEPSKMMAFEVEMDNTAVWGLRCIEYWEEERES